MPQTPLNLSPDRSRPELCRAGAATPVFVVHMHPAARHRTAAGLTRRPVDVAVVRATQPERHADCFQQGTSSGRLQPGQPQREVHRAGDDERMPDLPPASFTPMPPTVRDDRDGLARTIHCPERRRSPARLPKTATSTRLPHPPGTQWGNSHVADVADWEICGLWHTLRAVDAATFGRAGDERPIPSRSWTT
jgi:hypothetical protein